MRIDDEGGLVELPVTRCDRWKLLLSAALRQGESVDLAPREPRCLRFLGDTYTGLYRWSAAVDRRQDWFERGVAALQRRSTRPKHIQAAFSAQQAEQLRELLHRSPREFGKPTSLWTLELAAEVSFAQGLTQTRVSDETIRVTLQRLDVKWKRAK